MNASELRDQYAGMALQAIVSAAAFNQEAEDMMVKAGVEVKDTHAFFAMMAFDFADAMLKERRGREVPVI